MKLGSLFDGIGAFPLSAMRQGITPVWASEIDKSAIAVTKKHFPNMVHLGDITKINGAEIEPVDIITFGVPCQDWSIAGKRAGIDGARSGLFFEAVRIISEMQAATCSEYPKFLVFENVPGLLSANKGADIQIVLDSLQGLGFVVDMNVLDAQHMGVPQRRKRVFIVCVSVNFILRQRTLLSGSIIGQLLTKILQDILNAHFLASESAQIDLGYLSRLKDGLKRKMSLFEITSVGHLLGLQKIWEEIIQKHQKEQENSGCNFKELPTMSTAEGIWSSVPLTEMVVENPFSNTLKLWKWLWEEILWAKSLSTISTVTSETTNFAIYTCALINLHMVKHIVPLKNCYPSLSEMVSSTLTVMKECISYAKQARRSLSKELEWVERWDNYIHAASDCVEQIVADFRSSSAPEILFECESGAGDFAESRSAWKEVAACAGDGVEVTSWRPKMWCSGGRISNPLLASGAEAFGVGGGNKTAHSLRASPSKADKPCSTTYVLQGSMIGGDDKNGPQGDGINEDVSFTLNTTDRHHEHAHTFSMQRSDEYCHNDVASTQSARQYKSPTDLVVRGSEGAGTLTLYENHGQDSRITGPLEVAPTISQKFGTGGNNTMLVADTPLLRASPNYQNPIMATSTVRRLTPIECERLMGFPDNWTAGHSDSARYRMLGNSVAVPCAEYVFDRLRASVCPSADGDRQ